MNPDCKNEMNLLGTEKRNLLGFHCQHFFIFYFTKK